MTLLSILSIVPHGTLVRVHGIIAAFLLLLCCCSSASVYVSSLRNAPLMTGKGEFQSSASFGNGANVNAAYALTDHLGITVGECMQTTGPSA